MKIVGRIFIILLMALLVVGATLAFSRTSLAAQLASHSPKTGYAHRGGLDHGSEGMEGGAFRGDFPGANSQATFQGETAEGRRIEAGSDWSTWLKNLSIIGVIIGSVAFLDRIRFRKRRCHSKIT